MYPKATQTRLIYYCAAIVCCLMFPALGFAQDSFSEDGAVAVPVDGGLSLLVIAGAGYGARKIKKARSNKANAATAS
jgi:hypothetical protein